MAKLYRNATTNEYYTETAMDGGFVTLGIHPDGGDYLKQQGVQEDERIPAEMFAVLEENEWFTSREESASVPNQQASVGNESETNASLSDTSAVPDEPLPSVKLEPRPWMEQENVEAFREDGDATVAESNQPASNARWTQADRSNANAMSHPEDAAFVGNVWFWLLVVALMVIVVWGLVELF